jgi:fluoroquinolone resistance protein
MENETIQKKSFTNACLKHKEFSHLLFENCDFTQCHLTGTRFLECRFISCNWSLTKIDSARLQDVSFEKSKCVGVDFSRCDPLFLSLAFVDCLIDTCNFSHLNLKNTPFRACTIKETHFTECNLMNAQFCESNLLGSVFHKSDLTKANFIAAINYSINPLSNKLSKAQFSHPDVLNLLKYLEIIIE